jgi:hypothetical protein
MFVRPELALNLTLPIGLLMSTLLVGRPVVCSGAGLLLINLVGVEKVTEISR